jgi:hypothetical protein
MPELLSKKFPTITQPLIILKKVLQSYSIRHVSVVAITTIIREMSQTVPSRKQRCLELSKHVGKWNKFAIPFLKSLNGALLLESF